MRYIDNRLYNPNSLFAAEIQGNIPNRFTFGKKTYFNFEGVFISPDNKKKVSLLKRIGKKDIKKKETKPHGSGKKIKQHGAKEEVKRKKKKY